MTKPRTYKTEAIVLKRFNLGEADNIITLYTPNLGKIRAVAKGARKPKSRIGGHLDLLTQSSFLLAQGQNLDIITQSQTIESFQSLRTNLWQTSCAMYIAELVDQFTAEHVENYAVYKLLNSALLWLSEARNTEVVLRHFELRLLSYAGYHPELYRCLNCKSPLEPKTNLFSITDGGILCGDCARNRPSLYPISVDALKVMRYLLDNDCVFAKRLRIDDELSRELEQPIRWYIRYILERDVKSWEFLNYLQKGIYSCES